jgi:hypothetical protein
MDLPFYLIFLVRRITIRPRADGLSSGDQRDPMIMASPRWQTISRLEQLTELLQNSGELWWQITLGHRL